MSSPSTQLVITKRMGIYEPFQQVSMWGDNFKVDNSLSSGTSPIFMVNPSTENKVRNLEFLLLCQLASFYLKARFITIF